VLRISCTTPDQLAIGRLPDVKVRLDSLMLVAMIWGRLAHAEESDLDTPKAEVERAA